MIKICCQSGHWSKGGGAPEELATNKRVTDRVCQMLRDRGFGVYQTDWYGYNDTVVTKTDYNLFIAFHADMDYPNDGGSGFSDYAADDLAGSGLAESKRISAIINDVYFKESGIKYVSHSNANTKRYYMWQYLTDKTPCVLLEMGQSIDPHDKVLLANTELIASSIVRALCKAFNVSYETVVPPVVIPPVPNTEIADLKKKLIDSQLAFKDAELKYTLDLGIKNQEIDRLQKIIQDIKNIVL